MDNFLQYNISYKSSFRTSAMKLILVNSQFVKSKFIWISPEARVMDFLDSKKLVFILINAYLSPLHHNL